MALSRTRTLLVEFELSVNVLAAPAPSKDKFHLAFPFSWTVNTSYLPPSAPLVIIASASSATTKVALQSPPNRILLEPFSLKIIEPLSNPAPLEPALPINTLE